MNRESAIELVEQQINASKTFDDTAKRIAVLLRAADLLWVDRQNRSRDVLSEAFELAVRNFQENAQRPRPEGVSLAVASSDQRYVVIGAIAKRDQAWAMTLTKQMLRQQEDVPNAGNATRGDMRTAMRLLETASALVGSDRDTAMMFARMSFRYPASPGLPVFLYQLAASSKPAADQFYQQSFNAYCDNPMGEFLYLSSYPFGNDREAGDMPAYTIYRVPADFIRNGPLQRLFLHGLLLRAGRILNSQLDPSDLAGNRDAKQIWLAISRLAPQVRQFQPDLFDQLIQVQATIFPLLSQKSQASVMSSVANEQAPKRTLGEQVEAAEREVNADRHDQLLVEAIIATGNSESLDHLVSAAGSVLDSNVRQQLMDWIYFTQTRIAIKDGRFEQARMLASKVGELDQRAYLFSEIANGLLKQIENQAQVRDILDEVAAMAGKAPVTIVTARALLAVASLYMKIDPNRSIAVLGDAIKCINRLDEADFSRSTMVRKIEGKNFGSYASFQVPGFNLENAIREMGKQHFNDALYLASSFTDKSLRCLTTLVLAEICLQQAKQHSKRSQ